MSYKTFASSKAYVNKPNYFSESQRFGDENNYSEIQEDGFFHMEGTATVWDDLRFPATAINPAGAPSAMTFDQTNIGFLGANNTTQVIAVIAQMPHSWKIGSSIYPHIHWQPITTNVGNVLWRMEYKWMNVFETESGSWTTAPDTLSATDGIAFKHQVSSFGPISGIGKELSSILTIKISRVGGHVSDTYTGSTLLKEFDIHYEIDSLGSRQEYLK